MTDTIVILGPGTIVDLTPEAAGLREPQPAPTVAIEPALDATSVIYCRSCQLVYYPDPRIHRDPLRYCPKCGERLTKGDYGNDESDEAINDETPDSPGGSMPDRTPFYQGG
jgi:hypothetical protein